MVKHWGVYGYGCNIAMCVKLITKQKTGGSYHFDKDGKLIYKRRVMEKQDRKCKSCGEIYNSKLVLCNKCNAIRMRDYRARCHLPRPHGGAFNMVIRDEDTKQLYKFSCLAGLPPSKFTVVCKVEIGELLPKIYHEEKSYHD